MANGFMRALGAVYKGLVARLTRKGVNVGGTASYPRVEVHSVTEQEPLDKGGIVRSISCIIECMSEDKISNIMDMNEDNLTRLLGDALDLGSSWRLIGINPGQLQQITETTDTNKILYRLLQNVTIYVERLTE
jgi:hypothetical protein